jgi:hypothetical protein
MAWQQRTKEDLESYGKKRYRKFKKKKRGIEWKGIRATARDLERWKAVFKHSTPLGRSE